MLRSETIPCFLPLCGSSDPQVWWLWLPPPHFPPLLLVLGAPRVCSTVLWPGDHFLIPVTEYQALAVLSRSWGKLWGIGHCRQKPVLSERILGQSTPIALSHALRANCLFGKRGCLDIVKQPVLLFLWYFLLKKFLHSGFKTYHEWCFFKLSLRRLSKWRYFLPVLIICVQSLVPMWWKVVSNLHVHTVDNIHT